LVCGTGIGMAITANKIRKVRAAVCWNKKTAALASKHNGANVLCISGRMISVRLSEDMIQVWLNTSFGGGRHLRRIKKIGRIEIAQCTPR